MKLLSAFLALLIICPAVLAGCAGIGASPVDKYYKEIENLKVEENITESGGKLKEILAECGEKREKGEDIDWEDVESRMAPIIDSMEEMKDRIGEIETKDEKVKEINSYLVSSYEKLISGYKNIVEGSRLEDGDLLQKGANDLLGSQEDISKWQELLNE